MSSYIQYHHQHAHDTEAYIVTTNVCQLERGRRLQLHVLALYLLPNLLNGRRDELGFILLVRPEPANEVLQGSLPHDRGASGKWRRRERR